MNLLHQRTREPLTEKRDPDSVMDILFTDFFESRHFDDTMDAVFKHLAPKLVRHVVENEINEDIAEFTDGAIEGRWEKQRDWAGEDPTPKDSGYSEDSLDYKMGYSWGWANADNWEGNTLPADARKAAVEMQIKEFEGEISEEMVIAALEAANKKINPWELLKQAGKAVKGAYVQAGGGPKGLKAAIKKGLPVALSILVGEALDNVIIPMTFFSLTGIPIPPLPVGVGEIINPIVISMVGKEEVQEELTDELGWYEKEYGLTTSFGPAVAEVLIREYVIRLITEEYSSSLWRSSSEEFLQKLLANGSIESFGKDFVSISLDPGSGGQDKYGDVTMQLDFNQIMSSGGIEVDYEDPDFWEAFPMIAKHVTGYAGEDDYLDKGGDETTGQTFQEYAEDFYEEQEVVVPQLERDAIVSVSSNIPLSRDTLDLLAQYNIPVKS